MMRAAFIIEIQPGTSPELCSAMISPWWYFRGLVTGFRSRFLSDMVYDQLYMEYKLPEGINSTRVARDLEEIEAT